MTGSTVTLEPRGRTRINARAMTRVVSAVAAEALGVRRRQVSVGVDGASGQVYLTVRARIRRLPLDGVTTAATSEDTGPDRTERAQHAIRDTVAALTGATIAGVTVRLTGAGTHPPHRGD